MVSWILEHGGEVDVRSDEGATALMTAVQGKDLGHVATLIERKADINAKDARGFTALHRAAEMGHEEAVRVLLRSGANPNIEAEGHTALSLAKLRGNDALVSLLG
jgi:ankyrin repeat protein